MMNKKKQQRPQKAGAGTANHSSPPPAASFQDEQLPQLLQAMIEGIQAGVMISDDLGVLYTNPEFGRLLGYGSGETLEGMQVVDLIAEGDLPLAMQRRKAVAAGRRIPTGWVKFKDKSGEPVQMMQSLSRMFWRGQWYFTTAVNRASDQDLLSIQIRKTRARYERLLVAELEKQQSAIARELHDSLGSELAGISLMLGGLKAFRPEDAALLARLDGVLDQLEAAVEITRSLARGLMPVDTHAGAFWRALEKLASDWTLLKGVPCEFRMYGEFDHVPAETGTHLYRIAQEAIANALRHGKATLIRLRLTDIVPDLMLEIEDNGAGFHAAITSAMHSGGVGLRSMMARAKTIGGHIEFSSVQPVGSCVRVIWPSDPSVRSIRFEHD